MYHARANANARTAPAPPADNTAMTDATALLLLPDTLQWLPASGHAEQLMILLHGWGASAETMSELALALRREFPQAALLAPQGFEAVDSGLAGRQWFSLAGTDQAAHAKALAGALPRLADWLRAAQAATGLSEAATALVGFSQGALMALELAQLHDGIAGRVLSFAGRYARLPTHALTQTTLHFLHGADDEVIAATASRRAIERLAALQGDATIDIVKGVGHTLSAELLQAAVKRLRTHIPHRTWIAAMGSVPGLADRQQGGAQD